jgi:hypothetical protein
MKIKTAVAAAIACLALAVPGTALAISPTQDAYGGVAGQQEEGGNGGNHGNNAANQTSPAQDESSAPEVVAETETVPVEAVAATESGGSLPFTGLEVGVIALAGLFLVGGGAVLYRLSRHSQQRLQG